MLKQEWTVSVTNTFDAVSAEDAVKEMVEWLLDYAQHTGYQVMDEAGACVFLDADRLDS